MRGWNLGWPYPRGICFDPVTLTTIATIAAVGGTAATVVSGQKAAEKAKDKANDAASQAKKQAEQKTLMETQQEEQSTAARRSLLMQPTSGFGPNKNLARSFLTSL